VLANPIAPEMSDMRPSLLPGLVAAAQRNADRGFGELALFEVGQTYRGDRPQDQVTAAAAVRRGTAGVAGSGRHWSARAEPVSVFDAKADALALLDALGLPADKVQVTAEAPAWYHPGRSGTIRQGPKIVIGTFGEFHPKVLELLDAEGPLAGCELILEAIPAPKQKPTRTKPVLKLSDFQPVTRDFAFVVDRGVPAAKILRAAEGADRKLIAAVSVFDMFEGAALGDGKKSVAIAVTLQPSERTLTEQDIEAVSAKVVAEVGKATGGTLRA
jgi:phenylalanyl-tRNA synthetase beta chain